MVPQVHAPRAPGAAPAFGAAPAVVQEPVTEEELELRPLGLAAVCRDRPG